MNLNQRLTMIMLLLGITGTLLAAKEKPSKLADEKVFYIYQDKGSPKNHFIPSGWMGDFGDLKLDVGDKTDPVDGVTSVKWTYTAESKQGNNWAGAYYQIPANNWGDKAGGYDLKGFKRLTFWARGATDNVRIEEFKVGGITGEFGDSDSASIGPIVLTKDWKKYTIELGDKDLQHIIGGFCFAANKDGNPTGYTMYLDEIRYEK